MKLQSASPCSVSLSSTLQARREAKVPPLPSPTRIPSLLVCAINALCWQSSDRPWLLHTMPTPHSCRQPQGRRGELVRQLQAEGFSQQGKPCGGARAAKSGRARTRTMARIWHHAEDGGEGVLHRSWVQPADTGRRFQNMNSRIAGKNECQQIQRNYCTAGDRWLSLPGRACFLDPNTGTGHAAAAGSFAGQV